MNRKSSYHWPAVVCIALLCGACAGTYTEKQVAGASVENPEKITCKNVPRTGTRISEKVCRTNRAWADAAKGGRDYTEGLQRRGGHGQTYKTQGGP